LCFFVSGYFLEVVRGDFGEGGAEQVEGDEEVGAVALPEDVAFEACEGASRHADAVAEVEWLGCEGDGAVGMIEHEAEHVHLVVGDDGQGMASEVVGDACLVGEEVFDEGEMDDVKPFPFGGVDEDEVGDEHSLDLLLLPRAPQAQFVLGCHVGFVAEFLQPLSAGLFRVSADHGDEPLAGWYAYGVVNFWSWRNLIVRLSVDEHKLYLTFWNAFPTQFADGKNFRSAKVRRNNERWMKNG